MRSKYIRYYITLCSSVDYHGTVDVLSLSEHCVSVPGWLRVQLLTLDRAV